MQLERLLATLTSASVEFIIVGGVAARAHGSARLTDDLDVSYARSPANLARIVAALSPLHLGRTSRRRQQGCAREVRSDVKYRLTSSQQADTLKDVIRSFRAKRLKAFFETGDRSGLSVPHVARVRRMLLVLDAASEPQQVNLPGYFFHALRGERRWSIRVTGNWRITFGWETADAIDVDLEDYH